ncbi:MAG: hypothetical protein JO199_13025 [Candidatus Eremiobacteraeota bacterium]|nr:hypothetical protein [Candidatus Eremiobacteraeota bacterium]
MSADHVAFYYDQFLLEADGHVKVHTSDGFDAYGDAFSMDLKLNRFLVAGHVILHTPTATVGGAAVSDFLDFRRLYVVPVTTEPDRWTFLNDDLTHAVKGRVMPGDAFYFPTVPQTPSFTATQAVIGTHQYVRLAGANAQLAGLSVPLGSYVVNFSPNQYFAQNSLSGANFDAAWNFAGNSNSLSAAHLRIDAQNGTYLAFEQHFVGAHDYAIFSINPATKNSKWFNLQLYEKLGSRFQILTFTQYNEFQKGFNPPYSAQQTSYVNATQAFNHSYLQGTASFTNYNLLGPGSFGVHNIVGSGNLSHPSSIQFTDTSFQNKIFNLPLYEQYFVSYGNNHDTVGSGEYGQVDIPVKGLQTFGAPCVPQPPYRGPSEVYFCPTYTTIWNTILGFNVFTPSIKIGDQYNPYKTYYLNASVTAQRQWHSLPHHINTAVTTFSLSRTFSRPLSAFVSYQVNNTGDYYKEGGYQQCTPGPLCPASLLSFAGAATLRTLSTTINFAPQPTFNASIAFRHHDDFPVPEPGVFPAPTTNQVGTPLYTTYLGQPPNDITPDVRFKIAPHLMLDVSRTYYFHYSSQNWVPGLIIQAFPI